MITTNKLNHFANSKNSFIEIKCQHKLLTKTVNKRNLKNDKNMFLSIKDLNSPCSGGAIQL